MSTKSTGEINKSVRIKADDVFLMADLQLPEESSALVLFAHDGKCQNNPRTQYVAQVLRANGLGTLLCDLLTSEETSEDNSPPTLNAPLLARRLAVVTQWLARNAETRDLKLGYFGACVGGAAALIAAAKANQRIGAVVTRGGRLDLAGPALARVKCPTLLIVGEDDTVGMELNQEALPRLTCHKQLEVVPGASHLFGEPHKLDTVASLSGEWFRRYLT